MDNTHQTNKGGKRKRKHNPTPTISHKLDYNLPTSAERIHFLNTAILPFSPSFTSAEIEAMSNYILWGTEGDPPTNAIKEGYIINPSTNTTWKDPRTESLERLLTETNFLDGRLRELNANAPKAQPKPFSRSIARQQAPESILSVLEDLWRRIDENDLIISYYRNLHNRAAHRSDDNIRLLEKRLGKSTTKRAKRKASEMEVMEYLSLFRDTVEMRNEQYTIRDTYNPPRGARSSTPHHTPAPASRLQILPIDPIADFRFWKPIDVLAKAGECMECGELEESIPIFDFREESHVRALLANLGMLKDYTEDNQCLESFIPILKEALFFYFEMADLDESRALILQMRADGKSNYEIVQAIEKQYNRTHSEGYISTIVNKEIIGRIGEAATLHLAVATNPGNFNFKRCADCGKLKIVEGNFPSRKRNKDGYANTCTKCHKKKQATQEFLREQQRAQRKAEGLDY